MKKKIMISLVLCLFAGLTVFNVGLANRPDNSDSTLDLISVMAKAFDEGEGGVTPAWKQPTRYDCTLSGTINAEGKIFAFGKWYNVGGAAGGTIDLTLTNSGTDCELGGTWLCEYTTCLDVFNAYFTAM